jgi:hypothetical protein
MFIKATLLICVLGAILGHKKTIPHNFELPTELFKYDDSHSFYGIQLRLGSGNEKSHKLVNFYLDIGQPKALIGESGLYKHGVECVDPAANSCQFEKEKTSKRFYFYKELTVSPAQAYFTLDQEKLHLKDQKINKMELDLIVAGDSWWMGDWGVIGFAPGGQLPKYLAQLYEGDIRILPFFSLEGKNDNRLQVFLNPQFEEADVLKKIEIGADKKHFVFPGELKFIDDEWNVAPTDVCLTNLEKGIILVEDAPDRCEAVHKIICKGEFGNKCTKSNSDFKLAPDLVIKIDGTDFVIKGNDYLYYGEKNVVACRFDDPQNIRSKEICSSETTLALGAGFLRLFPTVFDVIPGKPQAITFLKKYSAPNRMGLAFKALIVLGIAVLLIGGYLIYKTVWANKRRDEGTYAAV